MGHRMIARILSGSSACLVCALASVSTVFAQGDNNGFNLQARWMETATDGSGIQRGDPVTLTWSIVPDGTTINPGISGEGNDDSSLISFLDTIIGAGPGGSDLTQRPWFELLESGYGRWGEVSGLTMVYESADDGSFIGQNSAAGQLGVRGDFRVSGHSIDGQSGSNVLAYNYFPDNGDQVIDTDNSSFYSGSASNYLGLRNVISHEAGHGLGLDHIESNTDNFLMEPFINLGFDGPQFSDILGMHRGYGDINERNGGNDTANTATDLGSLGDGQTFLIGEDSADALIAPTDVDFVSIDGSSDTDFFSFTLNSEGELVLELTPMGPEYQTNLAGGLWDASAQNDLSLTLYDTDGSSILATSDFGSFGEMESIAQTLLAGTYFAQVSGSNDGAQMFQLYGSFSAVPEPGSTLVLVGMAATLVGLRRRR